MIDTMGRIEKFRKRLEKTQHAKNSKR
jgi:ribosomal protein L31